MRAHKMLMIAPAPAIINGNDIIIDEKFASGMTLQASLFPGDFDCILREATTTIPFQSEYDPQKHAFGLTVLKRDEDVEAEHLAGYDVIFCSADDERNFRIADLAAKVGAKIATTLEYTLETRKRIAQLESGKLKGIYRTLKLERTERRRREFLAKMDAIQANGYPALEICRAFDPETLLFLDNRMTEDLFATPAEMNLRENRLAAGQSLTLAFSGRLEALKGAQDLVPLALQLKRQGTVFSLDIYGDGSLKNAMASQIDEGGLADQVTLHGAVDFESELVPKLRKSADLFICPHLQSDPSCTYIESFGCGLPILGYDNAMWRDLSEDSGCGWTTPMGRIEEAAARLQKLDQNRQELIEHSRRALTFAKSHDFHTLSKNRMEHLAALAVKA